MMANDERILRLGAVMRDVGARLSKTLPMTFEEAQTFIPYYDLGYAAAVLFRLEARGIAQRVAPLDYRFVRGPMWWEAANFHRWYEE
jgi:hypothetical protein